MEFRSRDLLVVERVAVEYIVPGGPEHHWASAVSWVVVANREDLHFACRCSEFVEYAVVMIERLNLLRRGKNNSLMVAVVDCVAEVFDEVVVEDVAR